MKKTLLYLILLMSIVMAGTVAYVSIGGLLKVFSGAGTLGLILFSSIEIAKIVATSAIHTYGKIIGKWYKVMLSLGIGIAMIITSMGIYGFLSSTYKESYSKMENVESRLVLINKKRDGYQLQLKGLNSEKESIDVRINELSKGISNNVIQYKDKDGTLITTTSSSTRKTLEKQLNTGIARQSDLNIKIDEMNTKVFDLDNQILEINLGNDVAGELGPLKYLSEVFNTDMDNVMKWFIFFLIIIGDPMAVLMVIVFNKVANFKDPEENEAVNEAVNEDDVTDTDVGDIPQLPDGEEVTDENIGEEASLEDFVEDSSTLVTEEIKELEEDVKEEEEEIDELEEEIEELEDEIEEDLKEGTLVTNDVLEKLALMEEKEKELKEREENLHKLDDEIKEWENTHWKMKRGKKPPSAIE